MRRVVVPLALCTLSYLGMGCADERCPPMEVCDIRERGCQLAVAEAMACLRGGSAATPEVEVISEQEYLSRTDEVSASDEDALARASWARGLALFDLSRPEVDHEQVRMQLARDVSAAYFAEERRVVVIDRGESMRSERAMVTLSHEIVHAMQDAEYGFETLGERAPATFDGQLALRALVEGEAVHYETLAAIQLNGWQPEEFRWQLYYSHWQTETIELAEVDAQPLDRAYQRLPYAFGGAFVSAVWMARGAEGVRALFDHPPRATREIMFGPADVDLEVERLMLDASAAPVLPSAFQSLDSIHLGAWIARVFAARMGVPIESRWAAPRALGADAMSVYRNIETDQMFVSWRVRLLPQSSASSWPLGVPTIDGWSDPGGRDLYLVAQSPGSTIMPRSLGWQELPSPTPEPQMEPAMESAQLHCTDRPFSIADFLPSGGARP